MGSCALRQGGQRPLLYAAAFTPLTLPMGFFPEAGYAHGCLFQGEAMGRLCLFAVGLARWVRCFAVVAFGDSAGAMSVSLLRKGD